MKKLFLLAVTLALGGLWLITLRPVSFGGPANFIIVSGESMEPSLLNGDLVITRTHHHYERGDVVAFSTSNGNVIHRIIGGDGQEGFVTQGDNRPNVDPWHPTNREVLGKQWIRLEGVGGLLEHARHPPVFGAVMGGLASFTILSGAQSRKKQRNGGRIMATRTDAKRISRSPVKRSETRPPAHGLSSDIQIPTRIWASLFVFAACFLVIGAVAAKGLLSPTETVRSEAKVSYSQDTSFDYVFYVSPSTLFPNGEVRAPSPALAGTQPVPSVPISLITSLAVVANYTVESDLPAAIAGTMNVDLLIKASGENGWQKRMVLVEPTPFEGSSVVAQASIDFPAVAQLIKAIETETGVNAGAYELTVLPQFHSAGRFGNEPVQLASEKGLVLRYDRNAISASSQLQFSEPGEVSEIVKSQRKVDLLVASPSVATIRQVAPILSVLFLGAAAVSAAVIFLGVGRSDNARVFARNQLKLVRVRNVDSFESQTVRLETLNDLARLARADRGVLFIRADGDEEILFLPGAGVTYEFAVPNERGSAS